MKKVERGEGCITCEPDWGAGCRQSCSEHLWDPVKVLGTCSEESNDEGRPRQTFTYLSVLLSKFCCFLLSKENKIVKEI